MKAKFLIALLVFVTQFVITEAFEKNSAYIKLFSQKTELMIKKDKPFTKSTYEIIFQFNDERAINLFRNYSIYYSFLEKIEDLKAYTVNPMGNGKTKTIPTKEFKTSSASRGSVFYDDQTEVSVDFLGLVPGSEGHIEYSITCEEHHYSDPMYFKYYLPIEKEEYELTIPNDVKISFIERNISPGLFTYTKDEKRKETIHRWLALDVPKETFYDDGPSRSYYSPVVWYKIEQYQLDGKTVNYCKTVDDLYAWYANNMKNVNRSEAGNIKILSDSICAKAKTKAEKAKAIYDWVKSNIRYVAFEAGMDGLIPRDADAVCNKRYGDCKDMTSLQFGLMKAAGLEPHYTWIGTRDIPYTYTELPLKNTDNHMINAIKLDNDWIFLDATDANGEFGIPTTHIQGKQALIGLDEKKYELVMVPVLPSKSTFTVDSFHCTLRQNNLHVVARSRYTGFMEGMVKSELMYMSESENEEHSKEAIKRVSNNAILQRHSTPTVATFHDKPFELEYDIPDYAREATDEKYFNIFLIKPWLNESITDTARRVPVSYRFNFAAKSEYQYTVPDGYKIDFVPADSKFEHKHFSYHIQYTKTENKLLCSHSYSIDFPDLLLHYEEFGDWNRMIRNLNQAYKESVVLKKLP